MESGTAAGTSTFDFCSLSCPGMIVPSNCEPDFGWEFPKYLNKTGLFCYFVLSGKTGQGDKKVSLIVPIALKLQKNC